MPDNSGNRFARVKKSCCCRGCDDMYVCMYVRLIVKLLDEMMECWGIMLIITTVMQLCRWPRKSSLLPTHISHLLCQARRLIGSKSRLPARSDSARIMKSRFEAFLRPDCVDPELRCKNDTLILRSRYFVCT